jgi:CO/xanthine dehydrogenase Mo-binding subunit
VNVGQGNTAALRMLVAEELDADLSRVRLVQGDTDLCPFDMGTFGSRSLPDSGEPLRRVAAGARQYLLSEGARRWSIPAREIDTSSGGVNGPAGRHLDYGQLAAGQEKLIVLSHEPPLRPAPRRRIVGRSGRGPSRPEVVTGALRFGSDRQVPGMLHAAVLRAPTLGAVLESLDTGPLADMPGVEVVRAGDVVAAVAGSMVTARAAADAIVATWWEPEPMQDDIATFLRSHPTPGEGWERAVEEVDGDVDGALVSARMPFEGTYTTAFLAHVPLETSSALASWGPDGRVTCEVGTQTPFRARSRVAEACGVEEVDVRIVVPPTGGAYGGKHGGDIAAEAAVVARCVGRPVQVHWSRGEEFMAGYLRPMAVIDIRAALAPDAGIAAWDHQVVNAGPAALALPYRSAARRLRSQPALSPVRQGSYRALGANANNFARESAIDEMAYTAGVDPLEFRLRHLADERLVEVLRRAASRFGWPAPFPATRSDHRGSGLAVGLEKGGRVATCAEVTVDPAGRVRPVRIVTAYECGTIVDPDTVRNQVEGATVMALGGALWESVPIESGRPSITCLSAYPAPRIVDMPAIDVLLIDRPDLPSAGAGETPMIAVAPALANAIFAATGERRRQLPLAPD